MPKRSNRADPLNDEKKPSRIVPPSGRARRIFDLKNPLPPTGAEASGFDELLDQQAEAEGKTRSQLNEELAGALTQQGWRGSKNAEGVDQFDELDALAEKGLTVHTPTELVLLAIAQAYRGKSSENFEEVEKSVARALHCLTGTPMPRGRPPSEDREAVCRAIAPAYFARAIGLRQDEKAQTLSALLKKHLGLVDSTGDRAKSTKDLNDKEILPYVRYFNKHEDRLMCRVSDRRLYDIQRQTDFREALIALKKLGVELDFEYIDRNWDTL